MLFMCRVRSLAFLLGTLSKKVASESIHFCGLRPVRPFRPLTPDVNKAFSSAKLWLRGYFLSLLPFPVNPRDGCDVLKVPADLPVWCSTDWKSVKQSSPRHCHVIGWLATCINKLKIIMSNKVARECGIYAELFSTVAPEPKTSKRSEGSTLRTL